jgi:hypothetical protein
MKYQLVLQFDSSTIEDFDELLKFELDLGIGLGNEHIVDGHDFVSNEINIFIHTDKPEKAFDISKQLLDSTNINEIVAAYRDFDCEEYTVIYPENYGKEFCIV